MLMESVVTVGLKLMGKLLSFRGSRVCLIKGIV